MNFKNKRFVTKGIAENVPLCLQLFMWMCIDTLVCEKDYLQVFEFSESGVVHSQEEPEFSKEHLLKGDAPYFISVFRQLSTRTKRTYETKNRLLCGRATKGYTKKFSDLIQ